MLFVGIMALMAPLTPAQSTPGPIFSTQTPTTGNSASTFFVFLPVANIGSLAATGMRLTSVTLNHLGAPATSTLVPAILPFTAGSGYLGPSGARTLDLEFDNTKLVKGNTYLLTVRGTYQVGGNTYGYALNRPVTYIPGFAATHELTLDAIDKKFDALPGIDILTDDEALLAFVSGLPQIAAAGLGDPPSTVWATFADDGEKLVILNNTGRPSLTALTSPALASAPVLPEVPASEGTFALQIGAPASAADGPTDLPTSIKARLLNAMGSGYANPVPDLHSWLVDKQAYSDPIGADTTVEALRNVGGDGVFYINSHAGADKNDKYPFNVWTTSPTQEYKSLDDTDPVQHQLKDDIDNKRLIDVVACDHLSTFLRDCVSEHHYGFTAEFINKHWGNFGGNAFVFVDTCDSDFAVTSVQNFKDAIFAKLASVYVGWSNEVGNIYAANTARLVFDRLLGANQFCPETSPGAPVTQCVPGSAPSGIFPQRPFEYPQVQNDLPLHSLGNTSTAKLNFTPNPYVPTSFGLLAPSISNMQVDETMGAGGQLKISGIFGQDPRPNGSVQVGGADANIAKWAFDQIVVDLALSGSAGDVQVKVRGHKSNVARLTDWRSNSFIFTYKENGSLQIQTTYNMHFRADVRKYRKMIHFEPDEPSGAIQSANDSTATFVGNGSGPGTAETFSLKGSGALVNVLMPSAVSDNIFALGGLIGDSKNMTFDVVAGSSHGCTCTACHVGGCQDSGMGVFGPSNAPNFSLLVPSFPFVLDETATIQKNAVDLTNLVPLCNTNIKVATGQFRWGSVAPVDGTAPDPMSAR
jgi:hypothetical protein